MFLEKRQGAFIRAAAFIKINMGCLLFFYFYILFQLHVYCENQMINGCPASFKVLADRSKVSLTRVERCTVGHLTELQVCIKVIGYRLKGEASVPFS